MLISKFWQIAAMVTEVISMSTQARMASKRKMTLVLAITLYGNFVNGY